MREFVTAVEQGLEEAVEEGHLIKIDDREIRYYRPTDGQLAVYAAATGRHSDTQERIGATIDLFIGMFSSADRTYLVNRLMDRDDPFGLAQVEEIMEALMEDWSGRPTQSSGASSQSPRNGGRKSTPSTTKSTSSKSPSTDS